jgi:hypothetical protein
MKQKTKTVYILGAGFSKEAKAPSQEELVAKIFAIHNEDSSILGDEAMNDFVKFLEETLHIPADRQHGIPLEDLFTPLDRCIADNISFRNLSVEELREKRELIYLLIKKTLKHLLDQTGKEYIRTFAEYLVDESSKRSEGNYKTQDPVSVLSTNWDILLDNSINDSIHNKQIDGVVDYCCYMSSFQEGDETIKPGLEVLSRGGFNVKLLKLHGSLNWLQCPRCQRLYVEFGDKIALYPYRAGAKPGCRHCNDNFGTFASHDLVSNLIMPTFLKDLSNPQYKIIWQNAGIELSEAGKLVFIGYSLQQADFEMRQLLSRMVDERTEIEVADFESPNDKGQNFRTLINRYEQFFGRKVKAHSKGAKAYIETEIQRPLKSIPAISK